MKKMVSIRLASLVLMILGILTTPLIGAAPVIIYDAGGEPLAPILKRLFEDESGADTEPPTQTVQTAPQQKSVPFALPIRTPEMSPGRVTPRAINQPFMTRPLFLIGTDRLSQQWLIQNRARLGELNAAGMIIQADTTEELQAIARISNGYNLQIMPASASDIAQQLGLKHYPVLIWKSGIEQ